MFIFDCLFLFAPHCILYLFYTYPGCTLHDTYTIFLPGNLWARNPAPPIPHAASLFPAACSLNNRGETDRSRKFGSNPFLDVLK